MLVSRGQGWRGTLWSGSRCSSGGFADQLEDRKYDPHLESYLVTFDFWKVVWWWLAMWLLGLGNGLSVHASYQPESTV